MFIALHLSYTQMFMLFMIMTQNESEFLYKNSVYENPL